MKFKKLLFLIIVLALLAGVSFLKKTSLEKNQAGRQALPQVDLLTDKNFSAGFVTKIEIQRGLPSALPPDGQGQTGVLGGERVVFIKDASGQWTLEIPPGAPPSAEMIPARKDSVETLLKSLAGLRGEVRADDKAVLGDFSLTDEKAFHFQLFGTSNSELGHVLVSPLRPRGTQNFVRAGGSQKVLATDTDVLALLDIFSPDEKLSSQLYAEPKPAPAAETPKVEPPPAPAKPNRSSFIKPKSG